MIRRAVQNQTNNTPQRTGNDIVANIAPWGDSDGHSGFVPMGANQATTTLWQGGSRFDQAVAAVRAGLPSDTAEYRLVQDATRDAGTCPLSPRIHSEWTFDMGQATGTVLPPITPTVRLDTDMAGNARWVRQTLLLSGTHQAGSSGGGTVKSASLDVSYDDGATWTTAPVKRVDGGRRAAVEKPRSAKGGSVTLRITMADDQGGKVTQSVHRAYGFT
ncbi:hypothetical protein ACFZBE_27325 [Streptomyces sp. NPDC008061]|uniref:hypothetical protein n=1 Tax=Streptomyces sp. NPDC008061 TaxID=3364805 RepID=UPI0036E38F48